VLAATAATVPLGGLPMVVLVLLAQHVPPPAAATVALAARAVQWALLALVALSSAEVPRPV